MLLISLLLEQTGSPMQRRRRDQTLRSRLVQRRKRLHRAPRSLPRRRVRKRQNPNQQKRARHPPNNNRHQNAIHETQMEPEWFVISCFGFTGCENFSGRGEGGVCCAVL